MFKSIEAIEEVLLEIRRLRGHQESEVCAPKAAELTKAEGRVSEMAVLIAPGDALKAHGRNPADDNIHTGYQDDGLQRAIEGVEVQGTIIRQSMFLDLPQPNRGNSS